MARHVQSIEQDVDASVGSFQLIELAPSILSADFADLQAQAVTEGGGTAIHVDVMDGHHPSLALLAPGEPPSQFPSKQLFG